MGTSQSHGNHMAGGVVVPERWIPAPSTVSIQAQTFLSNPPNMGEDYPSDLDDREAWRLCLEAGNASLTAMMAANVAGCPAEIITHDNGGVPLYEIVPPNIAPSAMDRVLFYIHGGAMFMAQEWRPRTWQCR